jgi:tRNA-2-methylthio-N6-dimethylallyladenosine synthase
LQERIGLERNRAMVASTQEVLVEGSSKKDPDRLTGRTRNNKLVHFTADGDAEGSFRTVAITGAHSHFLEGDIVGARAQDVRRRLALPLMSAGGGCNTCG